MNIDKRLVKAILAMKPSVRATLRSQVFLIAQQRKCGQRGFGHRDGLDRLLIVRRLLFSARVPIAVSDRPEDGKGVRDLLCGAPFGPFRQKVPDTFSSPVLMHGFNER